LTEPRLRDVLTPELRRVVYGVGFNALGNGLTLSLLMVYLTDIRDIPIANATLVLTAMAIVGVIAAGPVGTLIDKYGPRRVILVGLAVEALGVASWSQVDSFSDALITGALVSLGGSAIWPPQNALIARLASPETRQRVFGINFMLLNAGLGMGGLIAALLIEDGNSASFERLYLVNSLAYIGFFIAVFPLKKAGGPVPVTTEAEASAGYREVFQDRLLIRLAIATLIMLTFGYASVEAGLSLFVVNEAGLSAKTLGVIFGLNTATIVIAQAFVLKFIQGRSRSKVLASVGLMWAVSWALVGFSSNFSPAFALALIGLGQVVFAIGETFWSPIAPAMANDLAPEHLRGRYNAITAFQWTVANSIGPLVAGAFLGRGLVNGWILTLVIGCLFAAWLLLGMRKHLTASQDGRFEAKVKDAS
jgi:MFS family permease